MSASARSRSQALAERTILVVDDDDDVREMIATVLRTAGAEVVACADADGARAQLRTRPPDAALLDLHLGEHAAGELLPELSVPTGVVTGDLRGSAGGRILGHPVLAKPFRPAELISFVERLLAQPLA